MCIRDRDDPQIDQDDGERPPRLDRDEQEVRQGLKADDGDTQPPGPRGPGEDSESGGGDDESDDQQYPSPGRCAGVDPVALRLDVETALRDQGQALEAVSYTHLTLPTSDLV